MYPPPDSPATPEPYPSLPRTALLLFATLLVAGALSVAAMTLLAGWPDLLRMALPSQIALLGAIAWAVRRTGLGWREAVLLRGLDRRALGPLVLVLVGAVTVFSELYLVMQKLVPVPEALERAMQEIMGISGTTDLLVTVAIAVILAPILEEILFRGVILQGLARRHGATAATVWTAFFFTLFHFYNPWQLLPTFFLGLLLAWLVLTTRSIMAGILVHAAFNGLSLALFSAPLDPANSSASPAWVVAGVVAFLLAGSLALLGGMSWLEGMTGGGWFAEGPPGGWPEGPPDGEPEPAVADRPEERFTRAGTGP